MQIYLDTANINEIREAASWGILSGVTTNPSLMARESKKAPVAHGINWRLTFAIVLFGVVGVSTAVAGYKVSLYVASDQRWRMMPMPYIDRPMGGEAAPMPTKPQQPTTDIFRFDTSAPGRASMANQSVRIQSGPPMI